MTLLAFQQPEAFARRGRNYFIVGGAGFIGSHFVDHLLSEPELARKVTIYDNFSSGRSWHYEQHLADKRLTVVHAEVSDLPRLAGAMMDHDVVIHLASNPDIARAATEPEVDFYQGTLLTNNVVEAMRRAGVPQLLYASGSGVYGELGLTPVREDAGLFQPVSTYGASKLAGEALIASYCAMFGLRACAFRFANVVGPRQTHGVGFDFLRRLTNDPTTLRILGDGQQSKSYIHVLDVVSAVLLAAERTAEAYQVFNVSTEDAITVEEIADEAVASLGLCGRPEYVFTGGSRGWKGDVPVVRLNSDRIRALGWESRWSSREAIRAALDGLRVEERVLHA
ncbi:NAD-dependent epimerase/dehydratase family protein [Acidipila sp. EB88]|uniref:NAD-dependent epimerase/dehydratase family protein n=1 Tax=Acidipila sp. EB88 TaxID=2305226 RepID=UPI000F5F18C4|nr:NAD-dependent epimerase/dehydratase family protein [Acidipila sp. EB88]RRA49529.1 NAD-dependent epimerase/dehydratase family protein [Acidipila sp. EB88]